MLAKIDNLSINYEVYGQGERLLLLHGWATNLHSFETLIPRLSAKFQVIVLDLPGFGRSQAPQTAYGAYDYANFIEGFLEYLDINDVFLLGHSMGGAIALAYVLTHKRSKKIILEDSAGIRKKGPVFSAKIYLLKILKFFTLPAYREHLKTVFGSTDYKNAGSMRKTLVRLVNEDITKRLSKIELPILIIWGENDKTTPLADGKILNSHIKNSKLVVIPHCDHFPHLEYPDEVAKIITEFLKAE